MIEEFLTFGPRITYDLRFHTYCFRIQKRSKDKKLLEQYRDELEKHGISCSIIRTKKLKIYTNTLQIHGENVFQFLRLVNDYRDGEESKQICAQRIHTLAEIRKELSKRKHL